MTNSKAREEFSLHVIGAKRKNLHKKIPLLTFFSFSAYWLICFIFASSLLPCNLFLSFSSSSLPKAPPMLTILQLKLTFLIYSSSHHLQSEANDIEIFLEPPWNYSLTASDYPVFFFFSLSYKTNWWGYQVFFELKQHLKSSLT